MSTAWGTHPVEGRSDVRFSDLAGSRQQESMSSGLTFFSSRFPCSCLRSQEVQIGHYEKRANTSTVSISRFAQASPIPGPHLSRSL